VAVTPEVLAVPPAVETHSTAVEVSMAEAATVAAVDEINYLNLINSCTETERLTAEQRSAVSVCIGHYSAFHPSEPRAGTTTKRNGSYS